MAERIILKTSEEIGLMRSSALLVSKTLGMLAAEIRPGVIPLSLDRMAESYIRDHGAEPGFLGLYDFPNTLCISVNDAVVHGIPTSMPLQNGDIVSIDCGVKLNGFYGDQAYTFAVGEISAAKEKLLRVTRECLYRGIDAFKSGNRVGDIGHAIQNHAESNGFSVVRELVGHGLGRLINDGPEVPNNGKAGKGKRLQNGMVIAIEPMINMGGKGVKQASDGWTILTADGLPSAHFEHDVALVNGEAVILSSFEFIENALKIKATV